MRTRWTVVLALGLACGGGGGAGGDAGAPTSLERVADVPLGPQKLDLLFVLKNSGCGLDDQELWMDSFARLRASMDDHVGGAPSLHVGVVSTDVGTGTDFGIASCSADGDGGALLGPVAPCEMLDEPFLVDAPGDDGARVSNVDGALEDGFRCLASLGSGGCGFEQPLEAMRRALEAQRGGGAFLRADAHLAVILVSDEDDCSAATAELYDPDAADELGPLSSFRCVQHGVRCDQPLDEPGVKTGCVPRGDSEYLVPPDDYADFLRGFAAPPYRALAVTMAGPGDTMEVATNADGELASVGSCTGYGDGAVESGVRLASFARLLGADGHASTLCDPEANDAIAGVSAFLRDQLGSRCVQGMPQGDLADCEVDALTEGGAAIALPACGGGASPCFALEQDDACAGTPSGLALRIEGAVPGAVRAVARCPTAASASTEALAARWVAGDKPAYECPAEF